MSIAISVLIRPSRILMFAVLTMCTGCIVVGVAVGLDVSDVLPKSIRITIAVACIAAALLAFLHFHQNNKKFHIVISTTGLISITLAEDVIRMATDIKVPGIRRTVELLPSSTLWSFLMILNLRAECGKVQTLMILPDTVPNESFRALSVACRWIAGHNASLDSEES